MRGRLIQEFIARVARLDTTATDSGGYYDEDFREIIDIDTDGDGIGELQRQEHAPVDIPCQVAENTWEALNARDQGNAPNSDLVLYLHFEDLERMGLVSSDGNSLISVGDRLVSIKSAWDDSVVHEIRTPPGLYVKEARPRGWGINLAQPTRNLLRVTFGERSAVP